MEKKVISPAVKGAIIALVLIVLSLVIQFLNLTKNKSFGSIPFILLFAGIIWSAITFAKQMHGNVSFGNIFVHAFKTAAAVTAIMVIFTIISLKFISPEIKNYVIEEARSSMEAKNMSDDQIDTAVNFTSNNFILLMTGTVLLYYMMTGVIAALIGAAVSKKNPAQGPFVPQG